MENSGESSRLTFKKRERLHHRSLVEGLFREGKNIYEFPLRLTWRQLGKNEFEDSFKEIPRIPVSALQMMVTVPKKKRKRAIDRVLLRRRIREAYRLNRLSLMETVKKHPEIRTLSLAFIYMHNENLPYRIIENKMKNLLGKVSCLVDNSGVKESNKK